MLKNEAYLELSAGKFNVLQILRDICRTGNDETNFHVPVHFIASLFMVTEKDISLPPYPENKLSPIREFLDNYYGDEHTRTVDLSRKQIAELVDAVTNYRVYNSDNEKYIMNFVDRTQSAKRAGIHVDTVSKEEFARVLETVPEARMNGD